MANGDARETDQWVRERMGSLRAADGWRPEPGRAIERLRARRMRERRNRKGALVIAAGAAVALLLAAGPEPRVLAQRCVDCSAALLAQFHPPAARAELIPAAKRRLAPDFSLPGADGHAVRLSAFQGRVVLLNFWATWCGGCNVEIPWFLDFEKRWSAAGLRVVGVSFDEDGWKVVRPFLSAKKIDYPVVVAGPELGASYGGVDALPVTMVLDREGRIAAEHTGLAARGWYAAQIAAALAEGGGR